MGVKLSEWKLKLTDTGIFSTLDKMKAAGEATTTKFGNLQGKLDKLGGGLGNKLSGLGSGLGGLRAKLTGLGSGLDSLHGQASAPITPRVNTQPAAGGLSSLLGLAGRLGGVLGVLSLGKSLVTAGAELEQTRIQFETFTGSVEKGNAVLGQLQKFAQLTPFDDKQVISAGRQLLAFGETADSLNPILTKLGNISSATGKDFNELVSIYGKNKLSGIIQGEDLNQLNDSGIPVMDSLARQLGVTTSQVRKMGAEGKISFGMLNTAFDELGGPAGKWGDLMDKQSKTLAGRWSSLVGFAQNLGGKLGEMLVPFIGRVVDLGNTLLTFVQQNGEKIGRMFEPLRVAVQPLVDTFQRLFEQQFGNATAGEVLATVFNRVGAAIRLVAPFVRVAATLLGTVWEQGQRVVGILAKFWETSPRLQQFFAGLYRGALVAFRGIADAVGKYLGGVGDFLEGMLAGDFTKMGAGLKKTLAALGDTTDLGMKAAEGFGQGWEKGWQAGPNLFGAADKADKKSPLDSLKKATKPGGTGDTGKLKDGVKSLNESGRSVRNVTVNIGALLKDTRITMGAAHAGKSASELEDFVVQTLIRAISGAEQAIA